ncbi:YggS family pyridoxal phosphate-dependent enzyme [Dermatophilaceae bacterium Sec6.4]
MSEAREEELAKNLEGVRERIRIACLAAGRAEADITLIVVTKFHPLEDVRRLIGLGVRHIGENRDQEAAAKVADLDAQERRALTVHFVGQLQSNKAGHVAGYADCVQSVDRSKIAEALDRGAERAGRVVDVFIQVDLAGTDAGRGGLQLADVPRLAAEIAVLPALRLRGLMAVAPLGSDADEAFTHLQQGGAQLQLEHPDATSISAGMSGDLEQAIAHGATHLRVGSAILGSRPPQR